MAQYDAPAPADEDTDVESLEAMKAVKVAAAARSAEQRSESLDPSEDESFELPGSDLSGIDELTFEVTPQQADEFTCTGCFLVRHRAQRSSAGTDVCRDCD